MTQRVLEFKTWHLPTHTMHLVDSFNRDFVYLLWDNTKPDSENYKVVDHPLNRADCMLLQFTGRLDLAGVKIWEGDVLRLDITWLNGEIPEGEEEYSCYYHVLFHNGGFALLPVGYEDPDDDRHVSFLTDYGRDPKFVRVGSWHECPELLQLTETYPLPVACDQNHGN